MNEPRASLGLNYVTAMLLRAAVSPQRKGGNAMSQQWPDPNDPQPIQQPPTPPPTEAPGAPHTPEAPRETPQPDDGNGEPA